ncbi:Twin-arginine translocation pathway signal [Corticibacter populi]|uniref:Twin-arginine translocation pathway signal n=1 Tax=Corticibacter populi TaxID=1550736 RepID=A0A3M6QKH7_9BURK|nr:tripartite tricarboxylate transporter substrate-binding protein [Corticibacter populi]RMX03009.1 Twin-arginine translocation pathway signal [Corticibacter populi]RZS33441.1 tripartite-type tricarboxylate transporter receptor subunit TctC [Corticibacter populi]
MSKTINRRQWLAGGLHGVAALAAAAQWRGAWASAPVRMLVGFPPGGGTDMLARLLAAHLQQALGTAIVVDNRPGAGGQIAAQALKAAAPDGQTVFLTHDHTVSILPKVVRDAGFDTRRDFQPVAGLGTFVNALAVTGGHPAHSLAEYIDWVRGQQAADAGAIGIPAPASTPEFLVGVLARQFDLSLVPVPYRGSAPMIGDLLAGQIHAGIGSVQEFLELHQSGRLRVLAVLGGDRQTALPEVPTFEELGVRGFRDTPFYGIFAPKGWSEAQIARWEQATQQVLAVPEVRQQMQAWAIDVRYMDHRQFEAIEQAYSQAWSRIIEASGFQPQ